MLNQNQKELLGVLSEVKIYPSLQAGSFLIDRLMENTVEAMNLLKGILGALYLAENGSPLKNSVTALITTVTSNYPIVQDKLETIIAHADSYAKSVGYTNTDAMNRLVIAAEANSILQDAEKANLAAHTEILGPKFS